MEPPASAAAWMDRSLDRHYPARPWVAVGVVIVRDGKVLLIQRAHDPGKGLWAVPGGMVELGETCHETARREAKEETGLDVEVGDVFWVAEYIGHGEVGRVTFHNVLIDYLATAPHGDVVHADDAMDARWCGPDDLEDIEPTATMWPLLERLFNRSYAHRYRVG